jgi:7-cyano-7-deazaguanine synthase
VALSGGIDSTVLLAYLLALDADPLVALTVDYGQRHAAELHAAHSIASFYRVPHTLVDLRDLRTLMRGSSQTDHHVSVPHGHYTDASMKLTVVPNRNMILLAVAGAWAAAEHLGGVAYAAHADDHGTYPDCRPQFAGAMRVALEWAADTPIELFTPFLHESKAEIIRTGNSLHVPFDLTYSCYEGKLVHCGQCGACRARQDAFHTAHVTDPTPYAA